MDSTYRDEEYVSKVAKLAHADEVKQIFLFHHDPDQTDEDINVKLETTQKSLKGMRSSTA